MDESANQLVDFEYPLNERVRALLRLEFLFNQYGYHRGGNSVWCVRAALHCLMDILSVIGHSDLKSDLLRDLGQQRLHLSRLSDRTDVDQSRLREVLDTLAYAQQQLMHGSSHHPSAALMESELLKAIFNRFAMPGGTCAFDLPAYHRWLARPNARIFADLDRWYGHLRILEQAVRVYLHLLRETGTPSEEVAENGIFLYTPRTRNYHLIRVQIGRGLDIYPEVSATRHRFSIRFMSLGDVDARHMQAPEPIPFRLQCCSLAFS